MANSNNKNFQPDQPDFPPKAKVHTFSYKGNPLLFLPAQKLLGIILVCAEFAPDLVRAHKSLFLSAFFKTFGFQIRNLSEAYRRVAAKRKSPYCDFEPSEMEHYIIDSSGKDVVEIAIKTFRSSLGWHKACGVHLPDGITAAASSAWRYMVERKNELERAAPDKLKSFFDDCAAAAELREIEPLTKAVCSAAREMSAYLTKNVPVFIYDFQCGRHDSVMDGVVSADIDAAGGVPMPDAQRRMDITLRLYALRNVSRDAVKAIEDDKGYTDIINAFYGSRVEFLRSTLTLGCRVHLASENKLEYAETDPLGEIISSYNNIESFFLFLRERAFTVRELLDYAVNGMLVFFGIYIPKDVQLHVLDKLTKDGIVDKNVIDAIREAIAEAVRQKDDQALAARSPEESAAYKTGMYRGKPFDSDAAVIKYIELSNSKLNFKLCGKKSDKNKKK